MRILTLLLAILFSVTIYAQGISGGGPLNLRILNGRGNPNNTAIGSVGDLYMQADNTGIGRLWVKKRNGYSATGWTQLVDTVAASTVSYWTLTSNKLYPNSNSYVVGIGTTTPQAQLSVLPTNNTINFLTGDSIKGVGSRFDLFTNTPFGHKSVSLIYGTYGDFTAFFPGVNCSNCGDTSQLGSWALNFGGINNKAEGLGATTVGGVQNSATGTFAGNFASKVCIASGNSAANYNSSACVADEDLSFNIGSLSGYALGDHSFNLGSYKGVAGTYHEGVMGSMPLVDSTGRNRRIWDENDPIFRAGCNDADQTPRDGFEIGKSGRLVVGIVYSIKSDTTFPTLQIYGSPYGSDTLIKAYNKNGTAEMILTGDGKLRVASIQATTAGGVGKVLTSDANGVGTWNVTAFTSLDSLSIYATTPTVFTTYGCTDCHANGITGAIVSYINGAWRRIFN